MVTRADIEAFIAKHDEPAPGSSVATRESRPMSPTLTGPVEGDVRIPIKGVRKWTADAMVASAFTAPHVTEWVTLDVSRTVELVERLRRDKAFRDVKVSPTLIVAKAVCLAMRHTPELNAQWDDENQEIVLKRAVNLGIAAATDRGLVVPNIRDADRMTMLELAEALDDLATMARAGKAQPADLSGGTFTITNVGVFGVDAGTPIINPGESGILAVGAIDRRPVGRRRRPDRRPLGHHAGVELRPPHRRRRAGLAVPVRRRRDPPRPRHCPHLLRSNTRRAFPSRNRCLVSSSRFRSSIFSSARAGLSIGQLVPNITRRTARGRA